MPLPALSIKLQALREARGLGQGEMAERLGVQKSTLWRWEKGRVRPKGEDVIEKIKKNYGLTQVDLDELYAEWIANHERVEPVYEIRGFDWLFDMAARKSESSTNYLDEERVLDDLLKALISIDISSIPSITEQDEGTVEQWVPVFGATNYTWKLLTFGEKIIGYWHFVFLNDEAFGRAKLGELRDSEINTTLIETPTIGDVKLYNMYIITLAVDAKYRHPEAFNKLYESFVEEISRLAEQGIFASEICATAWTTEGIDLCRLINMQRVGRQKYAKESQTAEIFLLSARDVPKAGLLRRNENLVSLYRKRFGIL